ncbi:AMP nucleosidase [Parvularcula dongshanensis]|uniref:AMP nucleosidase n=1 Tax=Parvularcula dongshanensis TaxID=1173995 RepID=A0A840I3L8_9PROT|nr:AMP nucleosidase [Parvularcula dongshanensis]MBB4658804.1 AMP nucleosidase [Parvularcula dongshanensis]
MSDWTTVKTPDEAVEALITRYEASAGRLRRAFEAFVRDGTQPAPAPFDFAYPALRMEYAPGTAVPPLSSAFGKFESPGTYQTNIARPALFRDYLCEQIGMLMGRYEVEVSVGPSREDIPYPYVLESASGVDVEAVPPSELARIFPTPDLASIDDGIANGDWATTSLLAVDEPQPKPLALFPALRTDYSLQRLRHYTGTEPEDFQQFILFTNYHRYMDEFVELAVERLQSKNGVGADYKELVAPGGTRVSADTKDAVRKVQSSPWRRHQMPAYHLTAPGGQGITLVNIGVGPSNAKTITDHLAVLRPQCWIMIGHCGGLRHSQRLGDYVLAHAYLRRDHVLDRDLPPDIPIPAIAEVQLALTAAAGTVTGDGPKALKHRLRTGTVVTHDDRNWELRFEREARTLGHARAIAIDMESATVAANGYRFRVPYGTLLCVSDKPLHGEIKLPGAANRFYERAIGEHMKIGIEALEMLRRDGASALHSRKLRSFDEPPFR